MIATVLMSSPDISKVDSRNPLSIAWYTLALRDHCDALAKGCEDQRDRDYQAGRRAGLEASLRCITGQSNGLFNRDRLVEILRADGIEPV